MKCSIRDLIIDKISGEWGTEGSGVKVLRTTNFTNTGKIDFESIVTRNIPEDKINKKHLKSGDILIEKSGGSPKQPVGRVVYFDLDTAEKYLCNNFTAILRPNREKVVPKYLFYQLLQLHVRGRTLKYQNKTTGIHNLKLDKYLEEKIITPPLPTQRHIANILSKAENLIAQRKESIRLLDEFLKSTFLEMFGDPVRNEKGWKKVMLSEICSKIGSGATPRGGKESYKSSGISLVRSLNVHNDEFLYKNLAYINEEQANSLSNVMLKENDVLLNITGASVGRCCVVPKNALPARVNQHVSIVRPNRSILNPIFLSRLFTSANYQTLLIKKAKSKGATREAITKEEIENTMVIFPPVKLQIQFVQIVEKMEAFKAQYQQSLQELEHLYDSLSQQTFKGELKLNEKEEGVLIAAEPELQHQAQSQLSIPPQKKGFAKLVLAGKIISECKDSPEFTNIKFQKLQHLAEHLMEADLNLNYYNQAAGPYDNKFMHTLHKKMMQQKWFASRGYKYSPMEKTNEIGGHFSRYFGANNQQFSKLIKLLGEASEDQCEIISTLYAVWNDRIIKKESITNDTIIQDFFQWSGRKQKYNSKQLTKAIEWMKENRFEPKGFGELIKHSKKKKGENKNH